MAEKNACIFVVRYKSNTIRDPLLDGHFHIDLSMRLVPLHLEVIDGEVLDILHLTLDSKLRKRQRLSSQLKKDHIRVVICQ